MNILCLKKVFTILVILTLCSISFIQNINANIDIENTDNEIEIITEFYGLARKKPYTIKITQEKAQKLKNLLNSIERALDKSTTEGDAIKTFKTAFSSLYKFGLFPDESNFIEVQKSISYLYHNQRITRYIGRTQSKGESNNEQNGYINRFCIIAANMDKYCEEYCLSYWIAIYLGFFLLMFDDIWISSLIEFDFLLLIYTILHPIRKMNTVVNTLNSETNMYTLGLSGFQHSTNFEKIIGFTGIKLMFHFFEGGIFKTYEELSTFYLGFALGVK